MSKTQLFARSWKRQLPEIKKVFNFFKLVFVLAHMRSRSPPKKTTNGLQLLALPPRAAVEASEVAVQLPPRPPREKKVRAPLPPPLREEGSSSEEGA